ncbi:fimbrillin family protein [Phocaeicola plebeius]|uniref:fimbrillin family protein n=1 Tax=Phocaeicola plebeius TaxID=310297 RepID=UPI0026E91EE5|nr:fimbrillin family protein [Phocaeicola plebeius]
MKTNLWKLSCMALAMAAIVTGCNQNNELGTPAPSSEEDVLNVVATANDFVSSDATSRVSETDYTTTFEEGDAIGVFVVCDGEALVSNMKMTLGADGTTWAGENGAKLYYYKDADYIAYSPYTEGLSVTSEEEIITHFTTNLKNSTGQSTLADYQAADLKTASVVAANVTRGQNITFSFAHKMSMIEIKVPIRAYKTTGGYEYSAPLGLKVTMAEESAAEKKFSLCTFGKETTGEVGSEVTKGIYRCIVAPSGAALNVEGQFQDGSVPVYFPATGGNLSVTPKAGEYKGIDVKYDYGTYSAERDLQVGDYYYADGSIYPNELSNVPETGCIGKIFSLSTTAEDKAHGWVNGYVIALKNVEGTMASATYAYGKWSSNTSEVAGGADNAVYSQNATNDGMTDDKKQAVFAAKNGYDMTLTLVEKGIIAAILARNYDCAYPEGTSGWFLPAPGQVVEFLNNMSPNVGSGSWDFSTSNGFTDSSEQTQKTEMLQAVQAAFSIGDFFKGQSIENGVGAITDRWWTTLEVDEAYAWAVEMKVNGLLKFLPRGKNSKNASVRPILAF